MDYRKKNQDTVKGVLYRASRYSDNTTFKNAPYFKNIFPDWGGFEMEYPYEDYTAHWNDLHSFMSIATTKNDAEFKANIATHVAIDNAMHYYMFINVLRAPDNVGKNYFLAKRKQNTPFFFVSWDLDALLGNAVTGFRNRKTNGIITNEFFTRLLKVNPSNYNNVLKAKWNGLRAGIYHKNALIKRIENVYEMIRLNLTYEKEELIWSQNNSPKEELEYLKKWVEARLLFLDSYFNSIP